MVIGAHHDTAPEAPGAYDDGGGVGILIELGRVLARDDRRPRTIVLASFDGEEAGSTGQGTTAGSRAFVERLGPRARAVIAAFAIEMSGWRGGTPVLHPIAYADPREMGRAVIAPAWLVRAALEGSREAGAPLGVGDPWLSWLYQPAVRTFRVRLYGDDLSFLQAGHPALFASDSSFSAFYPDYHKLSDTADKLDAAALERMGRGVLGVVRALERVPRGPAEEPQWFAAIGRVVGWPWLIGLGAASLLPGLWRGWRAGGLALAVRLVQSMLAGVFVWLYPVPALWLLLVPHLLLPWRRSWWTVAAGARPGRQPARDRRLGLVAGGRERRLARAVGDRGGRAGAGVGLPRPRPRKGSRARRPEARRAQAPVVTPVSQRAPAWWASRACWSFRGASSRQATRNPPARRR